MCSTGSAIERRRPALAAVFLAVACADRDPAPPVDASPAADCAADMQPGAVAVLADGFPGGTEGLAFGPDGRLYVSTARAVHRVSPDGGHETVVSLESALGLAVWDDALHVAGIDTGQVIRIAADATTETVAHGLGQPNFLTPTPWGTLLSADDFSTRISEITPDGDAAVWLDSLPSPNGMGFAPSGATLYVASTFESPGLWQVPIDRRRPGAPRRAVPFPAGSSPDGLTVAPDGAVIVALNTDNRLVRVDVAGNATDLPFADDIGNPASLAFPPADARGYDRCSLYVTDLFRPRVLRLRVPDVVAPRR